MKNHTLKIENLPILTEELSNDESAAVKGGLIVGIPSLFEVGLLEGGHFLTVSLFGGPPIVKI